MLSLELECKKCKNLEKLSLKVIIYSQNRSFVLLRGTFSVIGGIEKLGRKEHKLKWPLKKNKRDLISKHCKSKDATLLKTFVLLREGNHYKQGQ